MSSTISITSKTSSSRTTESDKCLVHEFSALSEAQEILNLAGLPPLAEEDLMLLHLVLLALYHEGVRPTYSEVHYKLKEHTCSPDVERNFLAYYLAQSDIYSIQIGGNILHASLASLQNILSPQSSRARTKRIPEARTRSFVTGETLVLLKKEPDWFEGWVNLKSPDNNYSPENWVHLISFFRHCTLHSKVSSHFDGQIFKHTRYALAKTLKDNGPDPIRLLRLGEIAHMVQLAIQGGLLCYEANTIQPSWTSFTIASMRRYRISDQPRSTDSQAVRETLEQLNQTNKLNEQSLAAAEDTNDGSSLLISDKSKPSAAKGFDQLSRSESTAASSHFDLSEVVSIEELRKALRELLEEQPQQQILLSQLRLMLQARLGKSLVLWALGYTKISNLLVGRCSDVCHLVRHGSRHVFVAGRRDLGTAGKFPRGSCHEEDIQSMNKEELFNENVIARGESPSSTTSGSSSSVCPIANLSNGKLCIFAQASGVISPLLLCSMWDFYGRSIFGQGQKATDWSWEDLAQLQRQWSKLSIDFLLSGGGIAAGSYKELIRTYAISRSNLLQIIRAVGDISD